MKTLRIYYICTALLLFCSSGIDAQDLNAQVQVVSPKVQSTNKRVFQTLQTAIKDFLNGRKWSADNILPQERIDCTFILNITSWDGNSSFSGQLQVQSSRPVYNSTYNSPLVNLLDKDINFNYDEGQPLDYNDQSFLNNLTSVFAFYAYIVVGMDYDTFSRYGGSAYFAAAQNVVNNAQSSSYKGWKAFDGSANRYWLAENLNDKAYLPLRSFMYDYHRNGLDIMADNEAKGRREIESLLPVLSKVDRQRVGAMFPLVFFTAKSDELVSVLGNADQREKVTAMNILSEADPSNGLKYKTLQKSN